MSLMQSYQFDRKICRILSSSPCLITSQETSHRSICSCLDEFDAVRLSQLVRKYILIFNSGLVCFVFFRISWNFELLFVYFAQLNLLTIIITASSIFFYIIKLSNYASYIFNLKVKESYVCLPTLFSFYLKYKSQQLERMFT